MYFESRAHAGQVLATQLLEKYRYEDCAIIALSDGGVLVGEQIAAQLHCVLTMLVTEAIDVPGESVSLGAVSQAGNFTYNSEFSTGEIEEYASEFHGYLDDQKRQAFSRINRLVGDGGVISRDLLRERVVILVSDGFTDGAIISVALDYLKPIHIKKLVVAAPVATIPAVDQLHVVADELHILDVKENYMGTNHYYDDNTVPSREESVAKINQMILNWQ
ncbi:MAG: phosphoribosyltransferase [Acidobacteriota bacterium]